MHLVDLQESKAIPKPATTKGAQESARITWIKAQKRKNKLTLSAAEAKLQEPPAGTSTARRLQDPRHADMVRALVKVPTIQEMGLQKQGEPLYSKMMEAATRGLSASSGCKYFRYACTCCHLVTIPATKTPAGPGSAGSSGGRPTWKAAMRGTRQRRRLPCT